MNKKLKLYNLTDEGQEVRIHAEAIEWETYQIVVTDLENGESKVVHPTIVGLENIENRFDQVVSALQGAYSFSEDKINKAKGY